MKHVKLFEQFINEVITTIQDEAVTESVYDRKAKDIFGTKWQKALKNVKITVAVYKWTRYIGDEKYAIKDFQSLVRLGDPYMLDLRPEDEDKIFYLEDEDDGSPKRTLGISPKDFDKYPFPDEYWDEAQ